MKAIWKNTVIGKFQCLLPSNGVAESDDTVIVEVGIFTIKCLTNEQGNHYFPRSALEDKYIKPSDHSSRCFWKGDASYYDLVIGKAQCNIKVNNQMARPTRMLCGIIQNHQTVPKQ